MRGFFGRVHMHRGTAGGGGGGPTTSPTWIAAGVVGDTGAAPAYGSNVAGDLFVMQVAGRITAFTTPAGWTLQGGPNDQGGRRCYLLTRDTRSSGGEAGTVALTMTANSATAVIHTFRNVAASSFVVDVSTNGSAVNGNGPLPPAITSAVAHCLAVFGCGDGEAASTHPASIVATGGTWTRRLTQSTGTGNNSTTSLYTCDLAAAGTITGGDGGVVVNEHSTVGFALVGV